MAQSVDPADIPDSDPANHDLAVVQRNLTFLLLQEGEAEFEGFIHSRVHHRLLDIFRFLAEDQSFLDYAPDIDGSNINSTEFRRVWTWFRDWLSICHYESATRAQINGIARRAAAMDEDDRQRHPASLQDNESKTSLEMRPFRRLYEQMADLLAAWAQGRPAHQYDGESEMLRTLILAEDMFEGYISTTHVEDVLLVKRFDADRLDDPTWPADEGPQPWLDDIFTVNATERTCWNIRQLRQHGYKRPWKQLYLVFDTRENQAFGEVVQKVADLLQDPKIGRVVDVQPIPLSVLKDEKCAAMCGRYDDDDAGVSADFGATDVVILQQCEKHYIHNTCAFQWWDTLGQNNFSFPCPMCRMDSGSISEKLAIDQVTYGYNRGFDPAQELADAFSMVQYTLNENYIFLERQQLLPAVARRKAIREQERLLEIAEKQDQYYDDLISGWRFNPRNAGRPEPVHPRAMLTHRAEFWILYGPDQDDNPPVYPAAHFYEVKFLPPFPVYYRALTP